ncbi:hypothetical protein HS041_12375 [Planomonospora sp. ID67723]|uniref:hypothetical protein n=1 Tax=Planomonospora sp. ID67723 TaxID=2738134 RepID=UPI0018C3BF4C|nr:hypothetical protein [Planomonospora sp. ID67723]MBG0828565.1 hypothetical protein [Planomonospora sp. ID67723]
MAGGSNSFEGGTNGVAVSVGNSGGASGDAFNEVSGLTYANAQAAHGALSGSCGSNGYGALAMSGSGTRWARMYIRATSWSNPSSIESMRMIFGTRYFSARPNASGLVEIKYFNGSSDSLQATGAVAAATSQWIRLEIQVSTPASSPASCTVRLYNDADSLTPSETITDASTAITTGTWSQALFGYNVSFGGTAHIDSVAWSDVDWLGPILPNPPTLPPPYPTAAHRASRW